MVGRVHQINVSNGGVPKHPVASAFISSEGVEGDDQADKRHHGGPRQTVCLYSIDVIRALNEEGHPIFAGAAGENLTIEGLDWGLVRSGARLSVGSDLVLAITDPATPCSKNADWFIDRNFNRMHDAKHPGWSRMYARVVRPGFVSAGDRVELLEP